MRKLPVLYIRDYLCWFVFVCTLIISCKKTGFLDGKPDQSLVVPESVADLQSILDNAAVMNGNQSSGVTPSFGEIASDNYYIYSNSVLARFQALKEIYKWNDHKNTEIRFLEWDLSYRTIFYANTVLDGLKKLSSGEASVADIKGAALFFRASAFYGLAQVFCAPYDKSNSGTDLGLPLKLSADINERPLRSSVEDTYVQIINDLKAASSLLSTSSKYPTRPTKAAAFGFLARVYLSMNNFDSAWHYANECLLLNNILNDFNDNTIVNTTGSPGIRSAFNNEMLFYSCMNHNTSSLMPSPTRIRVDTTLISSYHNDDLRLPVFFGTASGGGKIFKGSYASSTSIAFSGLTTAEVYLIRAECFARHGQKDEALNDLNALLIKRWKTGAFIPYTAVDPAEALAKILSERRKELVFRGLRWTDIRRLNKSGANIELVRSIDGNMFALPPNDLRFTFLIPEEIMSFNSNWPQNPR